MLKKTIKYTDYMGNEREEDFYFNLSQAEVMEMEFGVDGGYTAMINRIVANQDAPTIMKTFKKFILDSYGVKTPDGRGFMKSEQLSNEFMATEAYSVLFMELCTDAEAATNFVNAVLPKPKDQDKPDLAVISKPQE